MTSSISAPASICFTASRSTYAVSPRRYASFRSFFPVGFMRSPMTSPACGESSRTEVPDETAVRDPRRESRTGENPESASCTAAMWAGVVPQHPPTIVAPASASFTTVAANSPGPTVKTVFPSTSFGIPAFGLTTMGFVETLARRSTNGSILSGPSPQLKPYASTPSDSSRAATHSTDAPVRSLPDSSSATVATTGRSEFSFAARTAALSSRASPIVSTKTRSAPAAAPARTISENAPKASSKSRSPAGLRRRPVGPMSSATLTPAPWRAIAIAEEISAARSWGPWYLRRFAPKVFARTMSAPDSAYARWTAATASGFSMFQSVGSFPGGSPAACTIVPKPPSRNASALPSKTMSPSPSDPLTTRRS